MRPFLSCRGVSETPGAKKYRLDRLDSGDANPFVGTDGYGHASRKAVNCSGAGPGR